MSINTDGQKKHGKFLKRNSKLLKSVKMTAYSFTQIEDALKIEFDNSDRSIIHAKFHDPVEIERAVREPEKLNNNLVDASRPQMAIIMPGDFTQDWHNERMNNKRRSLGFEDEDDFDYPDTNRSAPLQSRPTDVIAAVAASDAAKSATTKPTISAQPADLRSVMAPENSGVIPPEELVSMARPVSIVKEPYSQKNARETDQQLASSQPNQPTSQQQPAPVSAQEFIPLESEEPATHSPEDQAIATYKQRSEVAAQNAAMLDELRNEARSEGYNDGFRIGEDKGVVAGQQTAGEIFNRVAELLLEFEGLKRNVLENIQKNFFELSQAVAEALLEREFSVKPESFTKVLEKVLKDTVSDDQFKIRLHPETWQKVVDLKVTSLDGHLVKDPSIAPGEFKVESNLTVVDGNAKKIVAQMLQNVDMNLFEETKSAS